MLFRVKTTNHGTQDAKERAKLEALGFTFALSPPNKFNSVGRWYQDDCNVTIALDTLEQLMAFGEEWGSLIIDKTISDGWSIEIYNDYRE